LFTNVTNSISSKYFQNPGRTVGKGRHLGQFLTLVTVNIFKRISPVYSESTNTYTEAADLFYRTKLIN